MFGRAGRAGVWAVAIVSMLSAAGVCVGDWMSPAWASAGAPAARHAYITLGLLDRLPLWGIFALTVLLVWVCVWIGSRVGKHHPQAKDGPIQAIVAATLGLLAFVLAFTFGLASGRFDARKQVLLDEVESIGTTYLRTDLLPSPQRERIQRQLREYVDLRLQAAMDMDRMTESLVRCEQLHNEMWAETMAVTSAGHRSATDALFIDSLNRTIDLHNRRLATAVLYRIPPLVWMTLFAAAAVCTMMVGFLMGCANTFSRLMVLALAVVFSAVITLTAALDRPSTRAIRVSQTPMMELQRMVHSAPTSAPSTN